MGSELVFHWLRSSFSGQSGECVELGRAWRKHSLGEHDDEFLEVAHGAIRDSKNHGPTLHVDLAPLITFARNR